MKNFVFFTLILFFLLNTFVFQLCISASNFDIISSNTYNCSNYSSRITLSNLKSENFQNRSQDNYDIRLHIFDKIAYFTYENTYHYNNHIQYYSNFEVIDIINKFETHP